MRTVFAAVLLGRTQGHEFDIEIRPMTIRTIEAALPLTGPFGPLIGSSVPQDRFLEEVMIGMEREADRMLPQLARHERHPCDGEIHRFCQGPRDKLHCAAQRAAQGQLSQECEHEIRHTVPFLCRDEIQSFCSDLEVSIMQCLESHGMHLSHHCVDGINAVGHVLHGLRHPTGPKRGGGDFCPLDWDGPGGQQCCHKKWSPTCGVRCAAVRCATAAGSWHFRWGDFRQAPYACCPGPPNRLMTRTGDETRCGEGWTLENRGHGPCCRRHWSWQCGKLCAEAQCEQSPDFAWMAPEVWGGGNFLCCPRSDAYLEASADLHPTVVHGTATLVAPDHRGTSTISQVIVMIGGGAVLLIFFVRSCIQRDQDKTL